VGAKPQGMGNDPTPQLWGGPQSRGVTNAALGASFAFLYAFQG
jgi:hypothetical protein